MPEAGGEKKPAHEYRGNPNLVKPPCVTDETTGNCENYALESAFIPMCSCVFPSQHSCQTWERSEQKNPHVLDNGCDQLAIHGYLSRLLTGCSQHLRVLAIALTHESIASEFPRFKKKSVRARKLFRDDAHPRKKQGSKFAKTSSPARDTIYLRVVVHVEFPWMRAQANLILFFALHLDPGVDHILREHVALE